MSEFLAEARVLITPDTTRFRADLERALLAASRQITPIKVPVAAQIAGGALSGVTAGTTALVSAQEAAERSTLGLNTSEAALARTYGVTTGQIQILTASTEAAAGAQATLDVANKKTTASLLGAGSASARLDAGLLALRTAVGSTAVIGLGALALAGIAVGKAFRSSIQGAAELEQELNVFKVTANATITQMEAVGEAARDLGRDASLPAVTAGDAAEAMTDLAKAGLEVEDAIGGARGTLQLAAAAQIDVAAATELTANALNTFNLQGEDAVHVADLLTGASQAAQGDIADMGIALQQAGAAAKLAGVSLDDTITLIALLAKNGLAGSDAGTSLRTAFLALASPTDKARKIIKQLNLDLTDLQGNLRPEIFAEFFQATSTLTRLEQLDLAVKVFGRDAVRALGLIGSEGVASLEDMRDRVGEAGLAAKVAGARTQGLTGDVGALTSSLQTLGTTLGTGTIPFLSSLTRGINDTVKGISFLIDGLKELPIAPSFERPTNSLAELNRQIQETQEQIASFARTGTIPPALTNRLAELNDKFAELSGASHDANLGMAEIIDRFNKAAAAADRLTNSVASAADVLSRDIAVAAAQGNESRELGLLRQREANQQSFLERILSRPQTTKNVQLAQEAAENLERTRQQIQSILDKQASDTKKDADRAVDTRRKADDAFLDMIAGKRETRERFINQAEGTKSLRDDILLRTRFIKLLEAQIDNVRKTIRDATLRAATIRALTAEIVQVGNEIKRLRQQQRAAIKEAAQQRQQRLEESITLDIDLAQTTGNVRKEIAARQRLIALLRKQQAAVKKGTLEWKRLRNEIAEQNAAIAALKKEKQDQGNAFRELTFAFLQTQQGFAANLLGNLIPGGMTGGLVGGAASGGRSPADIGAGPQDRVNQAAAVGAARDRGVRPIQVDTTNQLLRRILRVLENTNGRLGHPEARYQQATSHGSMDTVPA